MRYSLVIGGAPVSSTNSSRILRAGGGRPFILKSRAAVAWQKSAVEQLDEQRRVRAAEQIVGPCGVSLTIYRARKAGDIDGPIKLVLDALQRSEWIENDKQVVELHVWRLDDATRPRIEITLDTEPAP